MKLVHPKLWRTAERRLEDAYEVTMKDDIVLQDYFSKEHLKGMGFEETKEEVEVPLWFDLFINVTAKICPLAFELKSDIYKIFLKHYPKQDTLPVEEIIKKLQSKEQYMSADSYNYEKQRKDFEDILRTYAIKDTTLVPLDVEEVSTEIISKYHNPNSTTYTESLYSCVSRILSKYWTPRITESQIEEYTKHKRNEYEEAGEMFDDVQATRIIYMFLDQAWHLHKHPHTWL